MNSGKSGYVKATTNTPINSASQNSWNAGAQYITGPFVLAARYYQGQDHGDKASATGTAKVKGVALGASYNVTSGLYTGPEYDHVSWSGGDTVSSQSGQSADAFMWFTYLSF